MVKSIILNGLDKYNKFRMRRMGVSFDESLRTFGVLRLRIAPNSNMTIGRNVVINSSWHSNPTAGENTLFMCEGTLKIGNHVGISNSTFIAKNSIIIEDYVNIGAGCKIYDSDFHSVEFEKRIADKDRGIRNAPIIIKNGAWIGGSVIILKGVTIGEKSVVGAGSVVTKDIPSNELWAGNPAAFIREL